MHLRKHLNTHVNELLLAHLRALWLFCRCICFLMARLPEAVQTAA